MIPARDLPWGKKPQKWFGGDPINEDQQAAWLKKQYTIAERYGRVKKIFWAFYRDTEGIFNEATDYFGVVRLDFTPKPAYFRMKSLVENYRKGL